MADHLSIRILYPKLRDPAYDVAMDTLRRDVARTRLQIIEAARTLVVTGESPALNAVARAADVGVGTVYRHFATVAELEEAMVWDQFDALAKILHDAGPEQLAHVLSVHLRLLIDDPLFEKVTSRRQSALERTSQLQAALIESLAELMDRSAALGHLRPDVGPAQVLLLLCGIAHSARTAQVAGDSTESAVMLRVVLDGLRPVKHESAPPAVTPPAAPA
jgi:AcrR family transcriptional regulator